MKKVLDLLAVLMLGLVVWAFFSYLSTPTHKGDAALLRAQTGTSEGTSPPRLTGAPAGGGSRIATEPTEPRKAGPP